MVFTEGSMRLVTHLPHTLTPIRVYFPLIGCQETGPAPLRQAGERPMTGCGCLSSVSGITAKICHRYHRRETTFTPLHLRPAL